MRLIVFLGLLFLGYSSGMAQNLHSLWALDEGYAPSLLNPATLPKEKSWGIGLASFYTDWNTGGINISNNLEEGEGDSYILNVSDFLSQLESQNQVHTALSAGGLGVGLGFGKWGIYGHYRLRQRLDAFYPEELARILLQGNAQYLGQDVNLSPSIEGNIYNELGIGVSFQTGRLSIGANLKYLSALGHISTQQSELRIYTDSVDYSIEVNSDQLIHSMGLGLALDDLTDIGLSLSDIDFSRIVSSNSGLAIDLGLQYELEDWRFSMSIIDLGSIRYTTDITNYLSQGQKVYEGQEINSDLDENSINFDSIFTELTNIFQFEENEEDFSYSLPTTFFVGASYNLNEKWSVGGSFYHRGKDELAQQSVGFQGAYRLADFLTLRGVYSWHSNAPFNFGLGVNGQFSFVEYFVLTDNLFALTDPIGERAFSLSAGVNLVFGKK